MGIPTSILSGAAMGHPTEQQVKELLAKQFRRPTKKEVLAFNLEPNKPIPLWLALTSKYHPYEQTDNE